MKSLLTVAIAITLAASAFGSEMKAFQMREDYGSEPLYDCYMQYYYSIPCPTNSWFWMYTGMCWPDVCGVFFTVGDPTMGSPGCDPDYVACDPYNNHTIEQFRVLDYAGYGTLYPGLYTVVFNMYCCDAEGCPVGPSMWNSGPVEFCNSGWNYISLAEPVPVTSCATDGFGYPRFLITATNAPYCGCYPAWGFDNISTPLSQGCAMHDQGCCPALYPRPAVSHYGTIHTGYYGQGFQYCPPLWWLDGGDTVGDVYGYIELAWRVYLINSGPDAVVPSTWGSIKSMYR
jgi:hypothetical protein